MSLDGIVSFLKKQAGPASVELKAEADFAKFISDRDAGVVGELLYFLNGYGYYSLCCQTWLVDRPVHNSVLEMNSSQI